MPLHCVGGLSVALRIALSGIHRSSRGEQDDLIATVLVPPVRFGRFTRKDLLSSTQHARAGNGLLAILPRKDRLHFIAGCDEVDLVLSDVLCEPGDRMRHAYFPTVGFISLLVPIEGTTCLEVGLIGYEGMIGTPLVLGVVTSPLRAVVQGIGSCLRMESASFRRECRHCPSLKETLDHYLCVRMTQLANAAGCARYHVVEARLARWLLMTKDRARSSSFHITHEFLARLLGVRRVGVTKAATSLQNRRLIRYNRGDITILDRPGLAAASCRCYQADLETYNRILG